MKFAGLSHFSGKFGLMSMLYVEFISCAMRTNGQPGVEAGQVEI
jgi:hypothetical protein